ncbi:MAG: glycosyltransferase family 2 protein [Candidatus Bathyarchaeota archaeon]|nr:glycosyltransferase family 2 protein [Candidatus Bathyarchaeota archaeon]
MEKVSVLIPVYMNSQHLESLLNSLRIDTYPNKEIIVCIDAPEDITRSLPVKYPDVNFIFNEERLGKVNALNKAVQSSEGDCLVFIDSDIEIRRENFLGSVVSSLKDSNLVDIKKIIIRDSLVARLVSYDYLSSSLTNYVFMKLVEKSPQFNGAAFGIRRETFLKLGGFQKVICEDIEMAFQAFRQNISFMFLDNVEVYNYVDPSFKQWIRQRRRWGIGLGHWIVKNFKDLLRSTIRNPIAFITALLLIFPSAPLIFLGIMLPTDLFLKLLSYALILLSSFQIYLLPSVYVITAFVVVAKSLTILMVSFVGTGVVFFYGAKKFG